MARAAVQIAVAPCEIGRRPASRLRNCPCSLRPEPRLRLDRPGPEPSRRRRPCPRYHSAPRSYRPEYPNGHAAAERQKRTLLGIVEAPRQSSDLLHGDDACRHRLSVAGPPRAFRAPGVGPAPTLPPIRPPTAIAVSPSAHPRRQSPDISQLAPGMQFWSERSPRSLGGDLPTFLALRIAPPRSNPSMPLMTSASHKSSRACLPRTFDLRP